MGGVYLKKYIYIHKQRFVLIILISSLIALSEVILSIMMGKFTNAAVGLDKKNLIIYGLFSVASLLLVYVFQKAELFTRNKFTQKCILSVKEDLYESVLYSSNGELHKEGNSYYINVITNELNTLRSDYFNNICNCVGLIFQIVLGSIALIILNVKLFIAISVVSVMPVLINPVLKRRVGIKKKNYIDSTRNQYKVISELFGGIDTIRMNYVTKKFKERTMIAENTQEQAQFESNCNDGNIVALTRFVGMTSQVICMLIAAFFVASGEMKIGAMISSTQLLNYVFPSINLLNSKLVIINGTQRLQNDIENILGYTHDQGTEIFCNGDIHFRKLSIAFGGKQVFKDFTYSFIKNKKTAIIGESGKGKSTLVKTLLGLNEVYDGEIEINSYPLKTIKRKSLYKGIAYAPQKPFIFKGSLEDNISMFKPYDKDKLNKIIEKLNIGELKGKILDDESSLSGGEASRVGVARAMMRKADIIIFDEPSSALDPITSNIINNVIFGIEDETVIVITHDWDEKYLFSFDKVLNLNKV